MCSISKPGAMCGSGSHTGGSEDSSERRFGWGLGGSFLTHWDQINKIIMPASVQPSWPTCSLALPFAALPGSCPIRSFLGYGSPSHPLFCSPETSRQRAVPSTWRAETSQVNAHTWVCCRMMRQMYPNPHPIPCLLLPSVDMACCQCSSEENLPKVRGRSWKPGLLPAPY